MQDLFSKAWAWFLGYLGLQTSPTLPSNPSPSNITPSVSLTRMDKPLLHFVGVNGKKHPWTLRHATMGTQVFGATGSGKSSGSGKDIAKAFLDNGFGGIVLCAKPGEREEWEEYAQRAGRSSDVIPFNEQSSFCFDPLIYESNRKTKGGGETLNMVDLIMSIYEIGQNFMSGGGGSVGERYWENALRRAVSRSIDLLKLLNEDVTIGNLRKVIVSAGNEIWIDDYKDKILLYQSKHKNDPDRSNILQDLNDIVANNYCLKLLHKALLTGANNPQMSFAHFRFLQNYFLIEYHGLGDKAKSSIAESFLGLIEPFLDGILKKFFTGSVSPKLRPEATYEEGKIIILDFSVKEYMLSGVYAQSIYKYLWQQAMERRKIDSKSKPVFLWADESQYFVNPKNDTLFQTTARSALVCTVYLTQNINNYYFSMGVHGGVPRTKSLVANLATKIFHSNSDFDTNEFASNIIGKKNAPRTSTTYSKSSKSSSIQNVFEYQVKPYEFTTLLSGGANRKVTAFITQTGRSWDDVNFLHGQFKQTKK